METEEIKSKNETGKNEDLGDNWRKKVSWTMDKIFKSGVYFANSFKSQYK